MKALTREQALIDVIRQVLPPETAVALADDAFVEPETGHVLTTDMLVAGRHFDTAWFTPFDLGWKSAAVNVSDIAAMGAAPEYLLVSLGLSPQDNSPDFIKAFYEGLSNFCTRYGCRVVGGDTVSSPVTVINVAATGRLPPGHTAGLRNAARPGDLVITTGFHGLSALGLRAFQQQRDGLTDAKAKHLRPEPCVREALALSQMFKRYALMDSSDGLADALLRIADASGVGIEIAEAALPVHEELKREDDALSLLLYGGEDFELVATVPELPAALAETWAVIGRVTDHAGEGVTVKTPDGAVMETLSFEKTYQHFPGDKS